MLPIIMVKSSISIGSSVGPPTASNLICCEFAPEKFSDSVGSSSDRSNSGDFSVFSPPVRDSSAGLLRLRRIVRRLLSSGFARKASQRFVCIFMLSCRLNGRLQPGHKNLNK